MATALRVDASKPRRISYHVANSGVTMILQMGLFLMTSCAFALALILCLLSGNFNALETVSPFVGATGSTLLLLGGNNVLASRTCVTRQTCVKATERFNSLLPHNQVLAKPLVLRLYELVGENEASHKHVIAIRDRVRTLEEISRKDKQDRADNIVIDNSDLEAVESLLEAHRNLKKIGN